MGNLTGLSGHWPDRRLDAMAYKRNPGTKRPRSNRWLAYVGLAILAAAAVTVAVLALTK